MGTRGLVGFKVDGNYRGFYCQYDTYPSSLGASVVDFIRRHLSSHADIERMRENARKLIIIPDGAQREAVPPELQRRYMRWYEDQVSTKSPAEWYCLLRKLQGVEVLEAIYSGELGHFPDRIDFGFDSLFCEHAYFLNLDEHALETFRGFQKEPQEGNPFGTIKTEDKHYPYPIALLCRDPFEDLPRPDVWVERVEKLLDEEEE